MKKKKPEPKPEEYIVRTVKELSEVINKYPPDARVYIAIEENRDYITVYEGRKTLAHIDLYGA